LFFDISSQIPTIPSIPPQIPTIFSIPPQIPTIFSIPPQIPTIPSIPPQILSSIPRDSNTVYINVVVHDTERNLYHELNHNFIVKHENDVSVVIGVFDSQTNQIRTLMDLEKDIGTKMGFKLE
jgi:hypothetical protein